MSKQPFPVTGDDGVGAYVPPVVHPADFRRVSQELLAAVRSLPGAATTASDVLDELGFALAVPASVLCPRVVSGVIAGQVLTIAYAPERRALSHPDLRHSASRLAHNTLFELAQAGDVVAVDSRGSDNLSVIGGMAAASAKRAGISACIVDGGVRDLDEIRQIGLSVWSRGLTPRTGKWRLETLALNQPIVCGGVQVHPGDVAIADETGVCFVPVTVAERTLQRILEVSAEESGQRLV